MKITSRFLELLQRIQQSMMPPSALSISVLAKLVQPSGSLSLGEQKLLMQLVAQSNPNYPIVEIGTLFGRTTQAIVLAKPNDQRLFTVDNFSWNPLYLSPNRHQKLTEILLDEAVRKHQVTIVKGDKASFYANWNYGQPSLVFLDAIHTYEETLKDISWAREVDALQICGHDYGTFPGVSKAIDEFGGPKQLEESFWVL